ncbi:MAG: hypothetical protein F2789_14815 [Actinobacteria bacterium]|nr:hypothetical protein [Actinomycetota bacterium]
MPERRRLLVSSVLLLALAWLEPSVSNASASDVVLNLAPAAVHVGEPIDVSAQFCGAGHQVSRVQTWHWYPNTKLPPIEIPVDVSTLAISQHADGFSFALVPTEREIGLGVRVTCDDGSSAGSEAQRVWVFGDFGDFFFLAPYGIVRGDAGATAVITARTMDCVEGTTVDASLAFGLPPAIVHGHGTVVAGIVELQIAIPADAGDGVYELTVTCPSVRGGVVADSRPFVVGTGQAAMPATGSPSMLLIWVGLALSSAGCMAIGISRRRLAPVRVRVNQRGAPTNRPA